LREFAKRLAALLLLTLLASPSYMAAQSFPDSEDGLRNFLTDSVSAAGKKSDLKRIAQSVVIPNYRDWFRKVFGEDEGERLSAAYRYDSSDDQKDMERRAGDLIELGRQEAGALTIRRISSVSEAEGNVRIQQILIASRIPFSMYEARTPRKAANVAPYSGLFLYVGDGFRWIRELTFTILKGVQPYRVRIGGAVQQAMLDHSVRPAYPAEAMAASQQGTVRLQIILNREGMVTKIDVVSGPSLLQDSAIQAVRQWRYRPTLLNGVPIEVVSTVDVVYELRR